MPKQNKLSEEDTIQYRLLTDKIQELYVNEGYDKRQIPFPMITKQIKNALDEDKSLTYAQLRYTLNYMVDTLNMDLFKEDYNGSIFNLVPYYIVQAREFCLMCRDVKESVKGYDFEDNINIIEVSGDINTPRYDDEIDISKL